MGLLPPQLEEDLNTLKQLGWAVDAQRVPPTGNQIFVIFQNYPLPQGWSKIETRLLLITDVGYPNSKIDMFWVEPEVMLPNNKVPQSGESIETYLGQSWRRFSWHVKKWNPAVDNVKSYLHTVDNRLKQII